MKEKKPCTLKKVLGSAEEGSYSTVHPRTAPAQKDTRRGHGKVEGHAVKDTTGFEGRGKGRGRF